MQFTELSELNDVINMMRRSSCNSPTFHDRQDSEVDRIYNTSPKMEMQLRNSWIDKIASFKPVPSKPKKVPPKPSVTSEKSSTKTPPNNSASDQPGGNPKPSVDPENAEKAQPKDAEAAVEGEDKKASDENADKEKAPATEDDSFVFVKEEILPVSQHETSLLDQLLKGTSLPMGQKPPTSGNTEGAVLHLTIYLPSRTEMKIDLYDSITVDDSIQEILRAHRNANLQPSLYYGHAECYELRLHDADGYPDEDFPALDRSRKIKNFGDAGGHEYCLCERPDACPPAQESLPEMPSVSNVSRADASLPQSRAMGSTEKMFLKIFMPKSDDYTVVAVDQNTTGQDLLPTLNKKHRLQLYQDQYVLKISEADRERLELASDEIDLQTKLRPLNLHEVTLATKQYADAPQVPVTCANTVDDTTQMDNRSRPPPNTFMFNDVTAAMFKEWQVIKKNKYGKKQQRMLGIDLNKIYNRKVGEQAIKSRNTTKIAERPISSVGWVRFLQDPCDFQIYFKGIEEIVTDYTAESPYECAEIVAKLKYILSRRKSS